MQPTPATHDRPHRFYKSVEVAAQDGGHAVTLDGRLARTPAGAPLSLRARPLADLVAAEWAGQGERLDMAAMAATRLAWTVIDRTAGAGEALAKAVARYAGHDVLCYRAEEPEPLVEEEAARWEPMLAWAREDLGVDLHVVEGLISRPQPAAALARVETLVTALEPFSQAGAAYAAPLFGSAVLALAVERGRLRAVEALELSRLDETFQEGRWGVDAEAAARTGRLREEAAFLDRWFAALR